jgi:hypothetical protein
MQSCNVQENDIFKMSDASSMNSYHTESGMWREKNKPKSQEMLYLWS